MSSRGQILALSGVGKHGGVDDFGEVSLETSTCFGGSFTLGGLPF
jgi:hypothetical protein